MKPPTNLPFGGIHFYTVLCWVSDIDLTSTYTGNVLILGVKGGGSGNSGKMYPEE